MLPVKQVGGQIIPASDGIVQGSGFTVEKVQVEISDDGFGIDPPLTAEGPVWAKTGISGPGKAE